MADRKSSKAEAGRPRLSHLVMVLGALGAAVLIGWSVLASGAAKAVLEHVASAKVGRAVRFQGFSAHVDSNELGFVLRGVTVASPPSITRLPLLQVESISGELAIAPLLSGRAEVTDLFVRRPLLHLVRLSPDKTNYPSGGRATVLQHVEHLVIDDGHLTFADRERGTLEATFSQTGEARPWPFSLQGHGALRGAPVSVVITGGALNDRPPDRPYPLAIAVVDGDTRVSLNGTTAQPFQFAHMDVQAHATGPNLADLDYLFGLLAPNSRTFEASGHIRRDGPKLWFDKIRAHVGASDIEGDVQSDRSSGRPRLRLALTSDTMALSDLQAMARPIPPHLRARAAPQASQPAHQSGLLSSEPIELDRLRRSDIDAHLRIGRISEGFPIRDVDTGLSIDHGHVRLGPAEFRIGEGRARVAATLDAASGIPSAGVVASVGGVRLDKLDPKLSRTLDGSLDGWMRASGRGASFQSLFRSARGRLAFTVQDGTFVRAKAQALTGDLVEAIGASLSNRNERTGLHCAVGELVLINGVLTAEDLRVVTDAGVATGSGRVDLLGRSLALTFRGEPARPHILQLNAPVTIEGSFKQPKVKIHTAQALAKAGPVGVLALAAGPLAKILPKSGRVALPDCARLERAAREYAR